MTDHRKNNKTSKTASDKLPAAEKEFEQIKNLQGLPAEIVIGFYESKGSIKDNMFLKRIEAYVR